MHAWLFLNRSPSRRWWYGNSNCDTCVVMQRWHNVMRLLWHRDTCHVSRYTGHDYVICIAIRIAILRSRYNTRIVGPSIAMHRCIDASLRPYRRDKRCITNCHSVNWFRVKFRLARRWCRSMQCQWHPWPTSHSWAKSTLFAPTNLRAVHTASRLNFRVIHCLCFRLCQRTRIACCLAEQTLPLVSSFMLDRSLDCADATSNQATWLVQDEANR